MRHVRLRPLFLCLSLAGVFSCGSPAATGRVTLTFPGSAVGAEAEVLQRQLARFHQIHPDIDIVQRPTPDAADQRHQLYVQWLNARAGDPDILQLDVIWTAEFAAAGWILPLDRFAPPVDSFFPATVAADTWRGTLYALPWFVDAGMLYYRTDLVPRPPGTFEELEHDVERVRARGGPRYGMVWQGARYEGLVTVFLEYLGAQGGRVMSPDGRIEVDSPAAIRALASMHDEIHRSGVVPADVLTWQEEQTRLAFQNGDAIFMRNWPYAYPLLEDTAQSAVAGRFAVAPMPAAQGGAPTSALGGSQLAINAHTEHPAEAYALIRYLTLPEQMLERARLAGQYPTRPALYADTALAAALPVGPREVLEIVEHAVPRPVTPAYTQLSGILQVWLHRALTEQVQPAAALKQAAAEMRSLLDRLRLEPDSADARSPR